MTSSLHHPLSGWAQKPIRSIPIRKRENTRKKDFVNTRKDKRYVNKPRCVKYFWQPRAARRGYRIDASHSEFIHQLSVTRTKCLRWLTGRKGLGLVASSGLWSTEWINSAMDLQLGGPLGGGRHFRRGNLAAESWSLRVLPWRRDMYLCYPTPFLIATVSSSDPTYPPCHALPLQSPEGWKWATCNTDNKPFIFTLPASSVLSQNRDVANMLPAREQAPGCLFSATLTTLWQGAFPVRRGGNTGTFWGMGSLISYGFKMHQHCNQF